MGAHTEKREREKEEKVPFYDAPVISMYISEHFDKYESKNDIL